MDDSAPRQTARQARELATVAEVPGILRALCDLALRFTTATTTGVLLPPPYPEAVWLPEDDDTVPRLRRLHLASADGPCAESVRWRRTVVVEDLAADAPRRWPGFARAGDEFGDLSLWCVPLAAPQEFGTFIFVRGGTGTVTARCIETSEMLAAFAGAVLPLASRLGETQLEVRQLRHALESRILIEQAKGRLAERHGLTPEEAFSLLRTRARTTNAKLRAVAADVAAGRRVL